MNDRLTLPVHPLTGQTALGVIGGRPVWPIRGGSEPAVEATPAAQAPAVPTAPIGVAPPATAPAAPAAPAPTGADAEPRDGEDAAAFLARVGPQGVAKLALQYRKEAGDQRVAKTSAEKARDAAAEQARKKVVDDLKPSLIALGILKADEEPDPAALTAAATAAQTQARTLTVENAVLRQGATLGVDTDRLLDSRKFADTVAALDPADAEFGGKVKAAIEAAVTKDATLKLSRAVSAAGLPHVGGSGGQAGAAPTTLEDAVAAVYNPTR